MPCLMLQATMPDGTRGMVYPRNLRWPTTNTHDAALVLSRYVANQKPGISHRVAWVNDAGCVNEAETARIALVIKES